MLIGNTEVNTGRQLALDYARGLAVICMILCHTVLHLSTGYADHPLFRFGDEALGGPTTAPLFMICLGIGLCYSRNTTPGYLLRRGIRLLLGGYLLNLCRGGLFLLIAGLAFDWKIEGVDADLPAFTLYACMIGDILMFAGITFMFFALVVRLRVSNWLLAVLAIVFQLVGHLFEQYDAGNAIVTSLWGLIIPSGAKDYEDCMACFPFLLWALYPIFGYLFGQKLRRVTDLDVFYRRIFLVTAPITVFYAVLNVVYGIRPFSDEYYWHTLGDAFFFLALDLMIISGFHLLIPYMPGWVHTPLCNLSHDITRVYCVSWCLILWVGIPLLALTDMEGIHPAWAYLPGVLFVYASYYLQKRFRR